MKHAGVVVLLTGHRNRRDKVGNLICGLGYTSKTARRLIWARAGEWRRILLRFVGHAFAVGHRETNKPGQWLSAEASLSITKVLRPLRDIRAATNPARRSCIRKHRSMWSERLGARDEAACERSFSKARQRHLARTPHNRLGGCRMRWIRARRSRNHEAKTFHSVTPRRTRIRASGAVGVLQDRARSHAAVISARCRRAASAPDLASNP